MDRTFHTITITIYDRDAAFNIVGDLLHSWGKQIHLRVGYPINEKNAAIIFLIVEMTSDELGALSGKIGQIKTVKVKSTTLKI